MSKNGIRNFSLTQEELGIAEALTKRFGTSYYWATQLFPTALRQATFVLYAFFRIPDEYVDQASKKADATQRLETWCRAWELNDFSAIAIPRQEEVILGATRRLFQAVEMPEAYVQAFLNAMREDLTIGQYETYDALKHYMYGSASAVGLMMTEVIGYANDAAPEYAEMLGEAMQLTNFLRDVGEDWDERARVYIPQEDLRTCRVTREMIAEKQVTPEFVALMRFEISRTRALYTQAEQGIPMLRPEGRRAVHAALVLYRAILDEIERNGYDVLSRRARTSTWRKLTLLSSVFFTRSYSYEKNS